MQTGPAVEDSAYMAFEAIWYAAAYVLGAVLNLANADQRLLVPLLVWLSVYVLLLRALIPQIGEASRRMSEARSMVTGRIADATPTSTPSSCLHIRHAKRPMPARRCAPTGCTLPSFCA